MTTDFHYRLAVMLLSMLNFCIFILIASILPAYFISSVKDNLASARLANQKNEPIPLLGEQSLATVKDINKKLSLVENAENNKFLPSIKVINAILVQKRSDIQITQIIYSSDPILGKKISINGTAPSREVLLLFRQALESSLVFKNIDLPISNFVKGSNIQFFLNLTPA